MFAYLIFRLCSLTNRRQDIFRWHYVQRKTELDTPKRYWYSPYVETRQATIAHLTMLRYLPFLRVPFTDESATGRMFRPSAWGDGVDDREQDLWILGMELGSTETTTGILAWQLGAFDGLDQLQRGNR